MKFTSLESQSHEGERNQKGQSQEGNPKGSQGENREGSRRGNLGVQDTLRILKEIH